MITFQVGICLYWKKENWYRLLLENSEISSAAILLVTTEIAVSGSWDFVQYNLVVDDSRMVVDEFSGSIKERFYGNLPYLSNDLGEWQRGTPCSLGIGNFCVSNPTDVSSSPLEPYFVMAGQIKETKWMMCIVWLRLNPQQCPKGWIKTAK